MSIYLLDVNVLIALLWPPHPAHTRSVAWFERRGSQGWATCPMTEAGLVRIVSTPGFSPDSLKVGDALTHLANYSSHSRHHFWPSNIPLEQAIRPFRERLFGHRQVTDAYLLGLALHHGGRLATLDRGIRSLLPPGGKFADLIEEIPSPARG